MEPFTIDFEQIDSWEFCEEQTVYDFEVENNHNYCLSTKSGNSILVHNSGKSQTMTQLYLAELLDRSNQNCTFFVIRKVASTLRNSVFQAFKDKITDWDLHGLVKVKSSLFEITSGTNRIVFMGCDDPEKLKSLSEAKSIWIEEATELSQEDFTQITLRLRGNREYQKNIYLTFNPVADTHWIKKRFFDQAPEKEKDMILSIKSNYLDNLDKLNEEYITVLESLKQTDETYYQIYALGDWGVWERDKLFCQHFDPNLHICYSLTAIPGFPLYLSFDFNITNTCVVAQMTKNGPSNVYWAHINIIRTYRINNLESLCQQILIDYPGMEYVVNGDASGRSGNALTEDNVSAYHLICNYLRINPEYQLQVPLANPRHQSSRLHMNLVFQKSKLLFARYTPDGQLANEELFADLKSAKMDNKQSLDTWKKENPTMGHAFDCLRYLVSTNCYEIVADYHLAEYGKKIESFG